MLLDTHAIPRNGIWYSPAICAAARRLHLLDRRAVLLVEPLDAIDLAVPDVADPMTPFDDLPLLVVP